jgi:hypothetical protein
MTDREILAPFLAFERPWEFDRLAREEGDATVVDAAWRVLLAGPPHDPTVQVAAMILGAVGGHGPRALRELAFDRDDPANDRHLVPLLLTLAGGDGDLFFQAIRAALDDEDPRRVRRALQLVRAGYGGRFAFSISRDQADDLDRAVTMLRALGTDDPDLAGQLASYIRPAPRE